jgi:hypothetical protein
MQNIKFGDKVKCSMKYITYWDRFLLDKVWKAVPSKRTGIFLGYRNIYEGRISLGFDLYDRVFKRTKKIKAGLVCYSEYINPIYVPVDNIELIKKEVN